MRIKGLNLGGGCGLDPTSQFVRHIPIMAFHHPDRQCWLWYLELQRSAADQWRGFRYFRIHGAQDRRFLQFWNWSIVFCWQDDGRFRNHRHKKQTELSKLLEIDFE